MRDEDFNGDDDPWVTDPLYGWLVQNKWHNAIDD